MSQKNSGLLVCYSGSMFSGKSSSLQREVRRALLARRRVQVFTSALDTRYAEGASAVCTHDGIRIEAAPVRSSAEIVQMVKADTDVVVIDEVQFLDHGIVRVANRLANAGKRVVCAGIDTDFRGLPMGAMGDLLAVADRVHKLTAICMSCGGEAVRNQRLMVDGSPAPETDPVVLVAAAGRYEARCRACHVVRTVTVSADEADRAPVAAG